MARHQDKLLLSHGPTCKHPAEVSLGLLCLLTLVLTLLCAAPNVFMGQEK